MKALEMKTDGNHITQASFNGAGIVTPCLHCCTEWERDNLTPNTRYACLMIAIPDGYRLVTDDEREKYKRVNVVLIYQDKRWRKSDDGDYWISACLYAVPIDHTWEEDKPCVSITVEVNGEAVDPATLSAESWAALRESTE